MAIVLLGACAPAREELPRATTTPEPGVDYLIQHGATGYCLRPVAAGSSANPELELAPCTISADQEFRFVVDGGAFGVRNVGQGSCVEAGDTAGTGPATVALRACAQQASQRYGLRGSSGMVTFTAQSNALALSVRADLGPGARLTAVSATGASEQRFTLIPVGVPGASSGGTSGSTSSSGSSTSSSGASTSSSGSSTSSSGSSTSSSGSSTSSSGASTSSSGSSTSSSGSSTSSSGSSTSSSGSSTSSSGSSTSSSGSSGSSGAPDGLSCPSRPGAPTGVAPLPRAYQVAYQRTEMTAFIHLGLATWDGTEQGDDAVDKASLFNPTNLDATQWVTALKGAGFRQAMLVTKHSTGFCLWPSAYTDYSVKSSPWKNGQGDVVKEFTDAMHAAGMRVALYLSPWDRHHPSSSPDYETYFRNQLTELLTKYGRVDEIEFDGFNAPRSIDWKGIAKLAHQLQPDIMVWAGPEIATDGMDVRWIGNENGQASRTTSSVGSVPNGGPANTWYPFETNVSDRVPNWFWHPNSTVMSLGSMQAVYFRSVGMNTTLNFNVPPAQTGQLDAPDVKLLQQFGDWYAALYAKAPLAKQPATADSTWGSGFEAGAAVDGDVCTYWAAAGGKTTGRLEVTPATAVTFTVVSLREPIELGERTTGYHLELKQNGTWNRAPTDAKGDRIQGTVIGQRQLWQLGPTTAEAIALVIDSAKDVPAIAELSVH